MGELYIKAKIEKGSIYSERIAYVADIGGSVREFFAHKSQTGLDSVCVSEILRKGNQVLVELPREASDGSWRLWVDRSQIVSGLN